MWLELRDARAEHETRVALFDPLLQRTHQVAVGARHEPIAQFDHRDRGAERIVHTGHLETDDAAAHHQKPLALLRQLQRTGRIDDARIIGESGQAHRLGPGCDDALLEIHAPRPVARAQFQGIRSNEHRFPAQHVDLALLCEHAQAVGQLAHDFVLPAAELRAIDLRRRKDDPAVAHVCRILDHLGGMQQGLGGNAADVQAHAAENRPALDERDLESQIGGAEGRGVAARSRAEDDEIAGAVGGGRCSTGRSLSSRGRRRFGPTRRRGGRCGRRCSRRRRSIVGLLVCGAGRGRVRDLDGRDHHSQRDFHALLDTDRDHFAGRGRRDVHGRLLAFERDQRVVDADLSAGRHENLDHGHILGVADIGNPDFDSAHKSAFTSANVLLRNTMKRAASAPSMTR